ncbi:5745_t:CDS:2 [Diversispora eburnea]|uniref:5745_t:CDS:1 n=1 Tax=Diversispora eburnea TaxID=1213867 RepID=A0A9N8V0R5_9GLOM|nr:5745_t:CDS:2 [Diversispora eburnea]
MSSKETSSSQPPPREDSTQQSQVEYQDCLACKLVGSTTFIGLGSYSIYQALKLNSTKIKNKSPNFRKFGLNVIGIFRFFQ